MKILVLAALLLSTSLIAADRSNSHSTSSRRAPANPSDELIAPEIQQAANKIAVRITTEHHGGSGVIIAQKGSNYLILTNARIISGATKIEIQAPDGKKYLATPIDGKFDNKYDLALLQFTSETKYELAKLDELASSPIEPQQRIYSAGFPFGTQDLRITRGEISQLTDIPFDDGSQIGYVTTKGEKGLQQGMNGGPILDDRQNLVGINTTAITPISRNYLDRDGYKVSPKLNAIYSRANWGIPIYNFLANVNTDLLYEYNLPQVERQVRLTGNLAKLNHQARQMTVRIENSGGTGSGVIIARKGNSYYVLTAKHVVEDEELNPPRNFTNHQIITADRTRQKVTSIVVTQGVDLAIVKFDSKNNYPIARLGKYSQNNDDLAFVGGFPDREDEINSPIWQWQLNPGYIVSPEVSKIFTQNNSSFNNGYDMYYGSITHKGMSGGGVFDLEGNLIGIHGRAESTKQEMKLGGSLGISINSLMGVLAELKISPKLLNKITKVNPSVLNQLDSLSLRDATRTETLRKRNLAIEAMRKNILIPEAGSDGKRWLVYGNQLTRILDFESANRAFDRAIAKGEVLDGNYGKTLSLLMLRKYDQAQDSVAKAISLVSDRERENYYFLWKYQSVIFVELYKYEEAIRSIDLAIELAPNDPLLPIQKAQILSDSGKYSEAIALSDKIIEDNKAAYAYYSRGLIKFGSGDAKGAVVDLIQATKINPNFVESYAALGIAKATLKDYRGALADADRAIKINPRNAFAHIVRCTANSKLGHFQDALTDSDRAIKFIQINDLDRVVIRTNVMFFALFQIQHCRNLAQSGLGDK
jgi:S1-C subfamily serine protease/tetratricopeptide (TPR) repeat protein